VGAGSLEKKETPIATLRRRQRLIGPKSIKTETQVEETARVKSGWEREDTCDFERGEPVHPQQNS